MQVKIMEVSEHDNLVKKIIIFLTYRGTSVSK